MNGLVFKGSIQLYYENMPVLKRSCDTVHIVMTDFLPHLATI